MPARAALDDVSSLFQSPDLPEHVVAQTGSTWKVCGEGVFSWSVFKFYRIRLLSRTGHFDASQPHLLDLAYLRKLSAQQIITISLQEIQRLMAPSSEQLASWRHALEAIVPDVGLGDRLLGWFVPGKGVYFFSAHAALEAILEPAFAKAFAAIWLDPNTQRPALRLALLGVGRDTP
ncbi:MAG: chalcone isomerase family protein [Alcaligenaceae bacterium]|nr:chalcone isomerase family protein [Alcaligenaceae bacterium]